MQRDLGRVYMVHWQGRRIAPDNRVKARFLRATLVLGVIAAVSLMMGFYSGLPVPIGLLQSVVLLVVLGLLAFGAWSGVQAIRHRKDRVRISGYRR